MAVLTDSDRYRIWAEFMRAFSNRREAVNINKPQLRAAVDAIDNWIDANQASFNNALPEPAKSALSAKHKAELLTAVIKRRWEVS